MVKKRNPKTISRENYLILAILGFVTLVLMLLFFTLFSAESQVDEVTKANCYAAASRGECNQLASEYGGKVQSECCREYDKCCP